MLERETTSNPVPGSTEPLHVEVSAEPPDSQADNAAAMRNPDGTWAKGNPGKPKGTRHMTTRLREAIEKVYEGTGETTDKLIIKTIVNKAIQGDGQAQKLIFEYIDGKPVQALEHSGPDGNPIDASISVTVKHV